MGHFTFPLIAARWKVALQLWGGHQLCCSVLQTALTACLIYNSFGVLRQLLVPCVLTQQDCEPCFPALLAALLASTDCPVARLKRQMAA